MKSPKRKRIEANRRRLFLKSAAPYLAVAILLIVSFMIAGCAKPKHDKDRSIYRVELGKKCLIKEDGSVAWSYVWIADQNVTLIKCK